MKFFENRRNTILFLVFIVVLIVPQTRTPLQVLLHKGIALINPVSVVEKEDREILLDYNWDLVTEANSTINLNQSKDKVTLINIWATWCPPCIAEMPSLQALYNSYGKQVDFYFITNDPLEKVEAFKMKNGYTFPVYLRRSNEPSQLKTRSIPRTLVISKNGEIIIDKNGAVDWNSESIRKQLDVLLAE